MESSLTNQEAWSLALSAASSGDHGPVDALLPVLYDELRRIAASYLANERRSHTLAPTALVNEAYLRLLKQRNLNEADRHQFMAAAATTMRRVLVEHARTRDAAKRGGGLSPLGLSGNDIGASNDVFDVLAIEEAMQSLHKVNPRTVRVVELRIFGGLTVDETAALLNVSPRTVNDEWTFAKAWLGRSLAR